MSKHDLEKQFTKIIRSTFSRYAGELFSSYVEEFFSPYTEELAETLVAQLVERYEVELSGQRLGKKEAARQMGVSEKELEALADNGEIRRQPVHYKKEDVDRFVMERYHEDDPYYFHEYAPH